MIRDHHAGLAPGPADDFRLPSGLVLRLADAEERHRASIRHSLGIRSTPASPSPADLTIRFASPLQPVGTLTLIGEDAAMDDHSFFLVRTVGGERRLVEMPLADLGRGMTLTCDAALATVPQLVPLLNATAITRGILPLHASAATIGGRGVAAAGWSKGGKTEALLAMCTAGATPIADEWCYLDPASRIGEGVMAPIRLNDDHLRQLPTLRGRAARDFRVRMTSAAWIGRAYAAISPRAWRRAPGTRWVHRLVPLVESQRSTDLDPRLVFGRAYASHRLDRIVLVVTADHGRTVSRSVPADEAVEAMVAAHMHHRLGLAAVGQAFRFAFPYTPTMLDELESLERSLLGRVFANEPVTVIEHPYPVSIAALRQILVRLAADGD